MVRPDLLPVTVRLISRFRERSEEHLNSSHSQISYAVFCLKKKKTGCPLRVITRPPGDRHRSGVTPQPATMLGTPPTVLALFGLDVASTVVTVAAGSCLLHALS